MDGKAIERRYTIGQASRMLGLRPHVLRYWEEEIPLVAPRKSLSGRRLYTERDLQVLFRIKHLLYHHRYTLEGARRRIWNDLNAPHSNLRSRIARVRGELLGIWLKVTESEGREENHGG